MNSIYQDIAERTNGDVYIGVVGPVRGGKSTFVSNFMEKLVLSEISDKNERARTIDELPQSADGKMIMTTQPKFVPNTAVKLTLDDKSTVNVRLIDCVGYIIDGAEGYLDGEKMRFVNTPWASEPMPFEQAAEIGTRKVATEHSTVVVAVTCDGTVCDIPRNSYVAAEEKTIAELKACGKPFVLVLNTQKPFADATKTLCNSLSEKYGVCVIPLDVKNASAEQLQFVLQSILMEFPVRRLAFDMPKWLRTLPKENKFVAEILERIKKGCIEINKMCDSGNLKESFVDCNFVEDSSVSSIDMGSGVVHYEITPSADLFFTVLSEEAKTEIVDEFSLMNYVTASARANTCFETMKDALEQANTLGYGVVCPDTNNMSLNEPEMVRQGSIYGVKLRATAPSYHIIRVDVSTEISPMVGTEQQSKYLLEEYKQNPDVVWNTNMFGKTMAGLAKEGLEGKCSAMPVEIKEKLTRTVNKIVNENRGGLICLLL